MGKIYGQTSSEIIPQDDFSASQSENGGWVASQSFRLLAGGLNNSAVAGRFPGGATLVSLSPNCPFYFAFLRLSKINSIQNVSGAWQVINAEFVGFGGSESGGSTNEEVQDTRPLTSKRGVLVDAPLDEHPKWKKLEDTQKFALGLLLKGDAISKPDFTGVGTYDDDGKWKAWEDSDGEIVLSGDSVEFARRIAQGRTTYKFASYEYSYRWQSNRPLPAAQLNALQKITTPLGNPAKPGTGRNWMLVAVDEEQNGSGDFLYDIALTWLLSDDGGFDSFLQE